MISDGDIIAVTPGEYVESVVVRSDVTIRAEIPSFHPPGAVPCAASAAVI